MSEKSLTREHVLDRLATVRFPGFSRDVVSFGMVKDVRVDGSVVAIALQLHTQDPAVKEQVEREIFAAVSALPGATDVRFEAAAPPEARQVPPQAHAEPPQPKPIPGIGAVVAVASGKGGVGKSTIAVNLAAALAKQGHSVALMDADIYGPSIPLMLGIDGQPQAEGNKMLPLEAHGMHVMSMGFFVPPEQAVIWRGPMVFKAVKQFLEDVAWGERDFLVVDLPPGTGDAQLTLVQTVPMDGAVIVTTPQEVSLVDARKAATMFHQTNCPILGVVENMSYFVCPGCSEETEIFARGGGRSEADRLRVPFLGEVPIDPSLREAGDSGKPVVLTHPDSPAGRSFLEMAEQVAKATAAKREGR